MYAFYKRMTGMVTLPNGLKKRSHLCTCYHDKMYNHSVETGDIVVFDR